MNSSDIRTAVLAALARRGVSIADTAATEETLLYQDGRAYARSYRIGTHLAMWLFDAHLVQIYDADGEMICALELVAQPATMRKAFP